MRKFRIIFGICLSQFFVAIGIALLLNKYPYETCAVDYLIKMSENWNWGLILGNGMIFLSLNEIKDGFNETTVLLYSSKKRMVMQQVIDVMFNAIILSSFSVLILFTFAVVSSRSLLNWTVANSFFAISYGTPLNGIGVLQVVLHVFVSLVVYLLIVGLFCLIIRWGNARPISLILILTVQSIIEICLGTKLITNNIRVKYEMWTNLGHVMPQLLMFGMLLGMASILLFWAVKRREFI